MDFTIVVLRGNPSSRSGTPLVQYSTLSASNTPVQSRSNTPVLSRNSTPSSSGARGVPFLQYGVPSLMTPTSTQLQSQSKYSELLAVVEDMSKDVRPTYAGSKTSMERFKRGIAYAKILLQQCKAEVRRSAKY
ncbi:cyclin-dependent kinase 2-associated protein 1-like [Saccoglossus kowalevskii]